MAFPIIAAHQADKHATFIAGKIDLVSQVIMAVWQRVFLTTALVNSGVPGSPEAVSYRPASTTQRCECRRFRTHSESRTCASQVR